MGKAVHNGTAQGYQLEVVDDGTGKIKGKNVSIVENGRKIIGEVVGNIVYAKKRMYFKEIRVTNLRKGETQNDYCFFEINADYFIKMVGQLFQENLLAALQMEIRVVVAIFI